VLQRSARRRPKLTSGDRLLWVCLSRLWRDWRSVLAIVKPETVVAWHRAGFRLFWTWRCAAANRDDLSFRASSVILSAGCAGNAPPQLGVLKSVADLHSPFTCINQRISFSRLRIADQVTEVAWALRFYRRMTTAVRPHRVFVRDRQENAAGPLEL
jgi:hypothetical protein